MKLHHRGLKITEKIIFYGRLYLPRLTSKNFRILKNKTDCISFFLHHSVVSACLPSPSSRNPLTCPVATNSAEHAGRGKSYFGLACGFGGSA